MDPMHPEPRAYQRPPRRSRTQEAPLALGVAATLVALFPLVGLIAVPVAVLGLVIGIRAVGEDRGTGLAVAGIVTCAVALLVCLAWLVVIWLVVMADAP